MQMTNQKCNVKLRLGFHQPQFGLGLFESAGILRRGHRKQKPKSFQSHLGNHKKMMLFRWNQHYEKMNSQISLKVIISRIRKKWFLKLSEVARWESVENSNIHVCWHSGRFKRNGDCKQLTENKILPKFTVLYKVIIYLRYTIVLLVKWQKYFIKQIEDLKVLNWS